jgi:hypothetical protein
LITGAAPARNVSGSSKLHSLRLCVQAFHHRLLSEAPTPRLLFLFIAFWLCVA